MPPTFQELANFIWAVADLLRGPYRPPQYERVMLPMTVLRRFDCVLEPTKPAVLARWSALKDSQIKQVDPILNKVAGAGRDIGFHNRSELSFQRLKGDPDNIGRHLTDYIAGFSENVRKIFERFEFEKEIEKLEEANRLYLIVSKFAEIDLHLKRVDPITMGLIFEDLIRRFNEAANETAGDHFTPREVIRLMVNLLLEPDTETLTVPGRIIEVCDPACGTGGMLSEAQKWIREHNPDASVFVYGQDYNPRSFAVAASDLLMKGQKEDGIKFGNTLTDDKFPGETFDYLLANPPFGVDWKAEQKEIEKQPNFRGYTGKLPRVNDGALLFLLHMLSKRRKPEEGGTRIAIVFNGSPLFTGGAGSGESEIRRWIIEQDWLEAIVGLPEQMFYNTGIGTFVWIVTNRKAEARRGKIQLLDAREQWTAMRRSLGDKRRYLSADAISAISCEHGAFQPTSTSKLFDNADFAYRRITVERPLRLRFQFTDDGRDIFLDKCPHLLDALLAIEAALGRDPILDWNAAFETAQRLIKESGATWTAPEKKLFRASFSTVDPGARAVVLRRGSFSGAIRTQLFPNQELPQLDAGVLDALCGIHPDTQGKKGASVEYEPDPDLRDYENVPLKDDVPSYFLREVRPYASDAWIARDVVDEKDKGIGKVGYEINFNRAFFRYTPPRPLSDIDLELKAAESRIVRLLTEVTS